jgi:hypothetical protein
MAQTYLLFDFGADEGKVQQARHKLDSWRQAFRLDKKLQFKFERDEVNPWSSAPAAAQSEKSSGSQAAETKPRGKPQATRKAAESSGDKADKNGNVKLFVRLYFSAHEKLSEQRWVARIPTEEPFKGAAPKVVQEGSAEFAEVLKQFDSLD